MTGSESSSRIHCRGRKLLSSSVERSQLCFIRVGILMGENYGVLGWLLRYG